MMYKALLFDAQSLRLLREPATKSWWLWMIGAAVFLGLPVTLEEVPFTHIYIVQSLFILFVTALLSFVMVTLLRGKTSMKPVLSALSRVMFFSSLLTAVLAFLSLYVFEFWLDTSVVSNVVTSIIPFYLVVLWAHAFAEASALANKKKPVAGVVFIFVLSALFFFL